MGGMVLAKEGGPDMAWVSEIYPEMFELVKALDDLATFDRRCDELAPKLKKAGCTPKGFAEFRTTALASMRSLLPHIWDNRYEAAWVWFWKRASSRITPLL